MCPADSRSNCLWRWACHSNGEHSQLARQRQFSRFRSQCPLGTAFPLLGAQTGIAECSTSHLCLWAPFPGPVGAVCYMPVRLIKHAHTARGRQGGPFISSLLLAGLASLFAMVPISTAAAEGATQGKAVPQTGHTTSSEPLSANTPPSEPGKTPEQKNQFDKRRGAPKHPRSMLPGHPGAVPPVEGQKDLIDTIQPRLR